MADDLISQWQRKKDPKALDQLRSQYTPLVQSQVSRFRTSPVPEAVLKAKADEIFVKSLETYNPNRGAQFPTHLFGNLRRLGRFTIERANAARIPEARAQRIGVYQQVRTQFIDDFHRPPTAAEMADRLSWPIAEVQRLERELRLDIPSSILPNPQKLDLSDAKEARLLSEIYFELNPEEKKVLEFVAGMNGKPKITEGRLLAKKLGFSEAKVSQIRSRIAKKMEPYL